MKDKNYLIKIDDFEKEEDFDDLIIEDIIDELDFDDIDKIEDIEDIDQEIEEDKKNKFNFNKYEKRKPIKKNRTDNRLYSTKIKIKDSLNEKLYPKNKIVKKITNLDTYEKIYDGVENTIKVVTITTGSGIKKSVSFTKKKVNHLFDKHQNISSELRRNIEGEVKIKVKTTNNSTYVIDIYIIKFWNEKCIKNLDKVKIESLIERIQLNKDEPYFLIKIKNNNKIKEMKIEKWAYDELLYKLNNL